MIEFVGRVGEYLGFPVAASEHALGIDHMNGWIHILMFILFIGWGAFFIFTLVKFGILKGNRKADYDGVKNHYSTYAEYGVILFEVFLLLAFAIPVWASLKTEVPEVTDSTEEIRVIAQQFAWNIHYPGEDGQFGSTSIYEVDEVSNPIGLIRDSEHGADDIVVKQLHIPVNKDIMIYLSSKDVIHSFALPEMRVKQDAIPGMTVPVFFKATLSSEDFLEKHISDKRRKPSYLYGNPEGVWNNYDEDTKNKYRGYQIACAQLCGSGHATMKGFMTVYGEDSECGYAKQCVGVADEYDIEDGGCEYMYDKESCDAESDCQWMECGNYSDKSECESTFDSTNEQLECYWMSGYDLFLKKEGDELKVEEEDDDDW